MREDSVVYVGVEAAKAKHAIAIAEGGQSGEAAMSARSKRRRPPWSALCASWSAKIRGCPSATRLGRPATGFIATSLPLATAVRSSPPHWSRGARHPARVTETMRVRLEGLPKGVREIAWKGQTRLCTRYRPMGCTGKTAPIVGAAIARERVAFLWAMGRPVAPAP